MLNMTITFDAPTERLLCGNPDPWLTSFECRRTRDSSPYGGRGSDSEDRGKSDSGNRRLLG